jgi:glycosyltransferase involved in cell wall biosynthesis
MREQQFRDFSIIACVNNYDSWWDNAGFIAQCVNNQESISFLRSVEDLDVTVIDRSSKGMGWPGKKGGVGWARKVAMDHAMEMSRDGDLIVCMDGDTYYPADFLGKVMNRFHENPKMDGLTIPYYHRLAGDETDRLILRYEIYMRYYLLNMLMINNPYAFTAIGSAMACTAKVYRRIGGITPVKSGEDFYFIQKLVKNGIVGLWCNTVAYPSPRFSSRVMFGTGPALIKGATGDWSSYPIYEKESYENIQRTFQAFPALFTESLETPMDDFLQEQFRDKDIWSPLRKNFKDQDNFVRACYRKVDGLRILQYLRKSKTTSMDDDSMILRNFLENELRAFMDSASDFDLNPLDLYTSGISILNGIRDMLYATERKMRKERDDHHLQAV